MRKTQVAVIGSSGAAQFTNQAYEIGRYIGKKGCTLVTGGRDGIMEAVSRGASEFGSEVISILPGPDFSEANSFSTVVIPTGIGFARNSINILAADIVIAVEGKYGTLSEIAYAMQYKKPLICCSFTGGWAEVFTKINKDEPLVYNAETINLFYQYFDSLLEEIS